jgi:surface protein
LPAGSFDTSKITTVDTGFFAGFNSDGSLTELPEDSFDTSGITGTVGDYFFQTFNYFGSLTSLPEGSFDTSNIQTAGDAFFANFNSNGSLASLPVDSFDTSNIQTAGDAFFAAFNFYGSLVSLPEGSFGFSGIQTAGDYSFSSFNAGGSLASLPEGSFDTSGITTVGDGFFERFSYNGSLIKGDESVALYFPVAATNAFTGTDIAPASPEAGATVYVNGDPDYSLPYTPAANGWYQRTDGEWMYFTDYRSLTYATGWLKVGTAWYWLDPAGGAMATGTALIGGRYYHLGTAGDGAMRTGWQWHTGEGYRYHDAGGGSVTGWLSWGGAWYWLDGGSHLMASAADVGIGGARYSFAPSGAMKTGWAQRTDGTWLYHAPSGAALAGWQYTGGAWYYLAADPSAASLTPGPYMAAGKVQVGTAAYLLAPTGAMLSGWTLYGGAWYYSPPGNGALYKSSWLFWNGSWYYLRSDGRMANTSNTYAPWPGASSYSDFDSSGRCLRYR